jgi:hypothetical protein
MQEQNGLQNKYRNMTSSETTLKNTHMAVGVGIIFGCGVICGWILVLWGILYV